jgi:hypothetical protein
MSNDNVSTQVNRSIRTKKLSPELDEFLHMLDALEDKQSTHENPKSQTR